MLRLVNINKRFHQFSLGSIDFEVQENEYFVILGPSGAGKTVLLELIAGLCLPTNGKILSGNCDITFVPPEKKGIGLVYQDCALFPSMNVQDNIIFGLIWKWIVFD